MTYLKRCVWAVAIAAVAAGGLSAQTTGTPTTTTTGGQTGGNTGSGINGSTITVDRPQIASTAGGFSNSAVQQSNIIAGYFANPSYPGRPGALSSSADLATVGQPGGFGAALNGGTGTAASGGGRATTGGLGRTGTTGGLGGMTTGGGRTSTGLGGSTGLGSTGGLAGGSTLGSPASGLGGTTGGLGGTGRTGGLGGTTGGLGGTTGGLGGTGRTGGLGGTTGFGGQNSTNQQMSTGRAVAYTQTIKFSAPTLTTPQLQTDIQSLITTSSTLSNVSGLQAVVGDGGVVVLRGKVADEDEARLVEGLIMLTPGVKGVQNELQVNKQP